MDMTRVEEAATLFEYERDEKGESMLEDDGETWKLTERAKRATECKTGAAVQRIPSNQVSPSQAVIGRAASATSAPRTINSTSLNSNSTTSTASRPTSKLGASRLNSSAPSVVGTQSAAPDSGRVSNVQPSSNLATTVSSYEIHDLDRRQGRRPTLGFAGTDGHLTRGPPLEPVEGPKQELGGALVREPGRGHQKLQCGPQCGLRLHCPEPGRHRHAVHPGDPGRHGAVQGQRGPAHVDVQRCGQPVKI